MSVLVTADALALRRAVIAGDLGLRSVEAGIDADLQRVLAHPLHVPEAKALLSRWGARCRDDGAELAFDPYVPQAQRCTVCGRAWDTEQARRWWVYWYQLWLAERVWMMALRSGPGGRADVQARAVETLAAIAAQYPRWPNADNVLGPSRPFFSTYLESVWVLQLAAAASLLEDLRVLPSDLARDLRARVFRPSADLIADFDEGRSNRQVWNAAALFALGRVLGDEAMQQAAADGPSGIQALVADGFGADGLWYEGENYHWFALRGAAWGAELLRTAGWPVHERAAVALRAALVAPALTVQPDFTFPARRDAKFGVSLRQRRMAELWELGRARFGDDPRLDGLLARVYDPALAPAADERWREITEVERLEPGGGVRRDALGWKALLWMRPEAPGGAAPWEPATAHLEASGIAVFRRDAGRTFVGLDYGEPGGGHGHADRFHLTLWHAGTPWLVDFGTGDYTAPTLAWYRSTLAHNAPLVGGQSQLPARGRCVGFDEQGTWGWVCALLPAGTAFETAAVQRTVVLGPGYLLDVVQMHAEGDHQLALPWHGLGRVLPDEAGVTFEGIAGALRVCLSGRQPFRLLVQRAPGPPTAPGTAEEMEYAVAVAEGETVTLVAAVDLGAGLEDVECVEDDFLVRHADGTIHLHRAHDAGWEIETGHGDPVVLGGLRDEPEEPAPEPERFEAPAAHIPRVGTPPPLDGTPAGFPADAVLRLEREEQFRRAEDPWPGADAFSARAYLAHDGAALYVAVDVTSPEPWFRPADLPDPEWENENPDIHSDGIQLYVDSLGFYGWLLVPVADGTTVRVAGVRGTDGHPGMIAGARWEPTATGYCVTFAVEVPDLVQPDMHLDLCVNRKGAGRERRWGQLVWSGARGSRLYLAGDRPVPAPLPRVVTT